MATDLLERAADGASFGVTARGAATRLTEADRTDAMRIIEGALAGNRRDGVRFAEAMTTSDFQLLFGDVLDRALLSAYRAYPMALADICDRRTVSDFRVAKRFATDGADSPLEIVAERAPYPEASLTDVADEIKVDKYGRRIPFSWETMVNDDLDALRDSPRRLALAAARTRELAITRALFGPTGLGVLFNASNTLTGNPALTADNLEAGLNQLNNAVDVNGEPIWLSGAFLVVGPGLETTAQRILDTREYRYTDSDGNLRIISGNGLRSGLQLRVAPYIGRVASSNASTAWAIVADPAGSRAAIEHASLRGHETPEVHVKTSNAQSIGGGPVDPFNGDFDFDTIQYRVRDVHGTAARVNTGRASVVGSNGSGS